MQFLFNPSWAEFLVHGSEIKPGLRLGLGTLTLIMTKSRATPLNESETI